MDFTEQLGKPIKIEEDSTVERDSCLQLADGIKEIEALQNKLFQRERELVLLDEKIKEKSGELVVKTLELYSMLKEILSGCFVNEDITRNYGEEFLLSCINKLFEVGKINGKSKNTIMSENAPSLIDIYNTFGKYNLAFEAMVHMASYDSWLCLRQETVKWAYNECKDWMISYRIENRIKNGEIKKNKFSKIYR